MVGSDLEVSGTFVSSRTEPARHEANAEGSQELGGFLNTPLKPLGLAVPEAVPLVVVI